MKKVLFIAAFAALSSACSTGTTQSLPAAPALPAPGSPSMDADDGVGLDEVALPTVTDEKQESLPRMALTPDVLFEYLTGEIADQRGGWQLGYTNMLDLARKTRDPRLARRAAEIALNAKQPAEAMLAVRLWHELAPDSAEAEQYYLGFLILGDDLGEALPVLQARLEKTPATARGPVILQIQRLLARARDKNAAFALLEELLKPYSKLVEARLALAQSAFARGDSERAVKEARAGLALDRHSELAALTLAQVSPSPREALQALEDFLYDNPAAREVRLGQARLLVEQQQYDKAQEAFEVLLKQYPNDLTTLYALGLLSTQQADLPAAEDYLVRYLEVLEASPDEGRDPTQALLVLSQIAEERKDIPAALEWLDQITPDTPDAYLSAQIRRAQLLARAGQLGSARLLLKKLPVTGETERVRLLAAEANILEQAGQPQQALAVLQAGLKTFPENVDLLYEYAMMAERLDQVATMEAALRKIMLIAPHNQHAYNALGYTLADRNQRLEEAHALIARALELAPEDPFIMDSMGWVLYRQDRLGEAEEYLRRAYGIRPDAEIAAHLGEVLWQQGKQEEARRLWRAALDKAPGNATLSATLQRLQVKP